MDDLAAGTAVALIAIAAWIIADPIRIVGGLPQATVGRPQWFSCCEVSNELSWRGVGAALVPVLAAALIAGWWARPPAVAAGALGATALITLGESMASTADVVPWSPQGRAYAVAVALAWPIGAGAAAALAHITRRRLGPR